MRDYINQAIGLVGRAGPGKDTAAKILCETLELRPYTFAHPVTLKCANFLNMSHSNFLALPKDSMCIDNLTKRQMMQHTGAQLRQRNEFFAIQDLQHRIECHEQDNYLFNGQLISDVRLPLEADWLRSKGGILIHIKRPGKHRAPADVTEQDLYAPRGEKVIYNTGTLEEFKKEVTQYAEELHQQLIEQAA